MTSKAKIGVSLGKELLDKINAIIETSGEIEEGIFCMRTWHGLEYQLYEATMIFN